MAEMMPLSTRKFWPKRFLATWPFMLISFCAMRARFSSTASNRLPGSALPVPASSSAVPWSTEVRMMGRPRVTLMPWPKVAYLRRGQPLVMVHGEHRVAPGQHGRGEHGVGGMRADQLHALAPQLVRAPG